MEGLNPTVMFAIGEKQEGIYKLTERYFLTVQYDIVMNRKFNTSACAPQHVSDKRHGESGPCSTPVRRKD